MAKLILLLDGTIIREYPIESETISIGRKVGNDIQLNDLTVSGRHTLVTTLGDHSYVDDLGSTNGTLVNGKRIKKALLKQSDIMQVGTHQFAYFNEEEPDIQTTMFIKAEFEATKLLNVAPGLDNEVRGEPLAAIKILNGPLAEKVLELRKPFNTLGFNGKKMAMISRGVDGYSLTSLNEMRYIRASDTPLINGNFLVDEAVKLKNNDIIEIVGTRSQFYFLS